MTPEKNKLKTNPKLHPSVSEYVDHLEDVRRMYQDVPAQELVTSITDNDQAELIKKRRISNIEHTARLLMVAPQDDKFIIATVEELNGIYKELLEINKTMGIGNRYTLHSQDLSNQSSELKNLYLRKEKLEKQLIDKETKRSTAALLGERLKYYPIRHAQDRLLEGNSYQSRREMLVVTHELMREALEQLTDLPNKKLRDKKLEELERSLLFYMHLKDKKIQKAMLKNLSKKAEEIAKGPELDKVRALMLAGKNKLQDASIDGLSLVFGGSEESMLVSLGQKAIKLERKLSTPPDYKHVAKELLKDIELSLNKLSTDINEEVLKETLGLLAEIRSHHGDSLDEKQKRRLSQQFKVFLDEVVFPVQNNIINVSEDLNLMSYKYSHGEDSKFETDSLGRAIIGIKGQDSIRAIRSFSPFGVLMPDNIELKPFEKRFDEYNERMKGQYVTLDKWVYNQLGVLNPFLEVKKVKWEKLTLPERKAYFKVKGGGSIDNIKIKSYWETGFWKDHELLSIGAQGSLGDLAGGSSGGSAACVAAVNGYWIRWWNDDTTDKMKEYLDKYGSGNKWPKAKQNEIRKELLVGAILSKRRYFQAVGIDLDKAGVGGWDKWLAGNLGGGHEKKSGSFERDTMYEEGTLQEAFKKTNYMLNLLGLENFNLDDF